MKKFTVSTNCCTEAALIITKEIYISVFWEKIASRTMPNGEEEFPEINDLVECVLVLPPVAD